MFTSSEFRVAPEWIDYNGHMNMAYYSVLADRGCDELFDQIGIGAAYAETQRHSMYTVEFHIRYLRELHRGDPARVGVRLLDFDAKKVHLWFEITHAEGWCAATAEALGLHVDMSGPRAAPFPDPVRAKIDRVHRAHSAAPRPQHAGRRVGLHQS